MPRGACKHTPLKARSLEEKLLITLHFQLSTGYITSNSIELRI